ncbi:MAG: class I SAM-dependent methyltransferase [Bacilli bacterium]
MNDNRSKFDTESALPFLIENLCALVPPDRITKASAWHGHIPFAMFLTKVFSPSTIVELGTHAGDSYCAFCQSVRDASLDTRCFAVDTWEGDEHAGFYGPELYDDLKRYHDSRYTGFSSLLRQTFDEAVTYFPDGSIDLLHIDGLHTYDAVHHDLQTWIPKLSQRGIVLLHDINVRERDFGVWKVWEEVKRLYPTFELNISYGIGLAAVGRETDPFIEWLCSDNSFTGIARRTFTYLGGLLLRGTDMNSFGHALPTSKEPSQEAFPPHVRLLQLYYDHEGSGFCEEWSDTIVIPDPQPGLDGFVQVVVIVPWMTSALRVDPVNFPALIKNLKLFVSPVGSPHIKSEMSVNLTEGLARDVEGTPENSFLAIGSDSQCILPGLHLHVGDQLFIEFYWSLLTESELIERIQHIQLLQRNEEKTVHEQEDRIGLLEEEKENILHSIEVAKADLEAISMQVDELELNLSLANSKSEELQSEIGILYANIRSDEAKYTKLKNEASIIQRKATSMTTELAKIKASRGYAVLIKYYQMRDRLFPPNSRRRLVAKRTVELVLRNGAVVEPTRKETAPSPWDSSSVYNVSSTANECEFGQVVDIVIPIYRGFEYTKRCIESVLYYSQGINYEIVLINDASPERGIIDFLGEIRNIDHLTVIDHAQNAGFVRSVNAGMKLHPDRDVVILNSDTRVYADWLDRLYRAAHSNDRIGTVTPFSNNATLCSYPVIGESNIVDPEEEARLLDALCSRVNSDQVIPIPTGVGFCMYIKRACIVEVGEFDEVNFGRGYGEENDFCMRALDQGWTSVAAPNVFVYHEGSVSFGEEKELALSANLATLNRLHPQYLTVVAKFFEQDPLFLSRRNVDSERLFEVMNDHRLRVMFVTHRLGGGVERHTDDLQKLGTKGDVGILTIRPTDGSLIRVSSTELDLPNLIFNPSREPNSFSEFLSSMKLDLIEIHHTLEIPQEALRAVTELGVPYDFTVHDYFPICPRINLVDHTGRYCGEPTAEVCNRCIALNGSHAGTVDITEWRRGFDSLLTHARRIYAPARDVKERLEKYYSLTNIIVRPHIDFPSAELPALPQCGSNGSLVVGIIGTLALHKGSHIVSECARDALKSGLRLKFVVVGGIDGSSVTSLPSNVTVTGSYESEMEVYDRLKSHDCGIIFFPAVWPETYSYTLSIALRLGLPIVAFDIGAIAERLRNSSGGFILPVSRTPAEINEFLLSLRDKKLLNNPVPVSVQHTFEDYFLLENPKIDQGNERLTIRVSPQRGVDGRPQASSEIRLLRPLSHPSVADRVQLVVDAAWGEELDGICVLERIPNMDTEEVLSFQTFTSPNGLAKVIYAVDDNLLALSGTGASKTRPCEIKQFVERVARTADAVIVSTAELKAVFRAYNRNVIVVPNSIDESLVQKIQPLAGRSVQTTGLVIGYMGTPTHDADFGLILPALERVAAGFPNVRLEIIGALGDPDILSTLPIESVIIEPPSRIYSEFISWFTGTVRWDIGLAPLRETYFNAAKSDIKFLDYGALGLAGLYSDVDAYRGSVQNGRSGLLVENNPDAWYDGLRRLVVDDNLRDLLASNSRMAVFPHRTTEVGAASLVEAIDRLCRNH